MLLMILISLALEIPTGYGQLAFNPIYFLKTQTAYGDYTYTILPTNISVSGFVIPFNNDISPYFSKTFDIKSSMFSFDFLPKNYNVKKALTILNSSKGSEDFSHAGLFIKEGYKNFSFSFSGDFASYSSYKTSAINPCLSYHNDGEKTSVFFYRFKRDSLRYIKILLLENKFDDGKKNVDFIYGESYSNRLYYFSGVRGKFYFRGMLIDLLIEKESQGSYTWRAGIKKSEVLLAVLSPFGKKEVLPEYFFRRNFKNLYVSLKGNAIQPIHPDSSYYYYSVAGIGANFLMNLQLYLGVGYLGENHVFAGGYKFITGNLSLSYPIKGVKLEFAGKLFKPLENINLDREFNSRLVLYHERKFGNDSHIGAGFSTDYFGDKRIHFSVFSDIILFNSVRVRVEEYNLNGDPYPFPYPGNSDRFYRISVVAQLWD